MALMIFMQKWCWFHFPKYYSFILHYFFLLDSRPAPRASAPPCCAAAWFARVSRAAAQRGGRGAARTALDPTCSRPAGPVQNQSTLDKELEGFGRPWEDLGSSSSVRRSPGWSGAALQPWRKARGLSGPAPLPGRGSRRCWARPAGSRAARQEPCELPPWAVGWSLDFCFCKLWSHFDFFDCKKKKKHNKRTKTKQPSAAK